MSRWLESLVARVLWQAMSITFPARLRGLFRAAIQYLTGKNLINAVIEVTYDGKMAACVEYRLRAD